MAALTIVVTISSQHALHYYSEQIVDYAQRIEKAKSFSINDTLLLVQSACLAQ